MAWEEGRRGRRDRLMACQTPAMPSTGEVKLMKFLAGGGVVCFCSNPLYSPTSFDGVVAGFGNSVEAFGRTEAFG